MRQSQLRPGTRTETLPWIHSGFFAGGPNHRDASRDSFLPSMHLPTRKTTKKCLSFQRIGADWINSCRADIESIAETMRRHGSSYQADANVLTDLITFSFHPSSFISRQMNGITRRHASLAPRPSPPLGCIAPLNQYH